MRVLAEFRRGTAEGKHGYPEANMFDQPELEDLLRANLKRPRHASRLRGNAEVTEHRPRTAPGPVRVDVRDRATGAGARHRRRVRARLRRRQQPRAGASIGAPMRDLKFEQRWLVVDVATDADLDRGRACTRSATRTGPPPTCGSAPTRYRWEFRLRAGETAEDYRDIAALHPLLAPWTGTCRSSGCEIVRVAEYTFRAQVADRWRDRRVFLLGDAAHLTPPFIGQGLCAGVRDAANLSWKLAGVLAGDAARRPSWTPTRQNANPTPRALIRLAKLVGAAMTEGGEFGNLLRRVLAPRLHLVPGLRGPHPRQRDAGAAPLRPGAAAPAAPVAAPAGCARTPRWRRPPLRRRRGRPVRRSSRPTSPYTTQRPRCERRGAVVVTATGGSVLHKWLRKVRDIRDSSARTARCCAPVGTCPRLCSAVPPFTAPSARLQRAAAR